MTKIEIQALIEKVVDSINSFDKIFVLGGITSLFYHNINFENPKDTSDETIIEYCQSICLATANFNQGKIPSDSDLKTIYSLLKQIKDGFCYYFVDESLTTKNSEIESEIRLSMILDTILVRGEGYEVHIDQLFKEMFSLHDDFFQENYGFKTNNIIETLKQLESSFLLRLASPNGEPHPFFIRCLKKWELETNYKGIYPADFAKKHPGIYFEGGKITGFPITYIEFYDKLYQIRHLNGVQEKVVKSLSLKFGENNNFCANTEFAYEILTETNIYHKPIVEVENDLYYLFSMSIGTRNYFNIGYRLIKDKNGNYFKKSFEGSRSDKTKDNFIERKVKQLFEKMLPNVQFFPNVFYTYSDESTALKCAKSVDGRYELDIIGISNEATYLIEVKSGLINKAAKRGAIQSISTYLKSNEGKAICQSYRAFRYMISNENCVFETSDGKSVKPINQQNVFRISITFSYSGTILSSLSKLQDIGIIDSSADFAWTINIFDLFVFAELIKSEKIFIDYLQRRMPFYRNTKIDEIDEMDVLGFYLLNGFEKQYIDSQMMFGKRSKIDNYFHRK